MMCGGGGGGGAGCGLHPSSIVAKDVCTPSNISRGVCVREGRGLSVRVLGDGDHC